MFNMVQLFSAVNCWLKCMLLDPYNQTDHPECKSRPDSGLSAITELDPGYITGRLYTLVIIFSIGFVILCISIWYISSAMWLLFW